MRFSGFTSFIMILLEYVYIEGERLSPAQRLRRRLVDTEYSGINFIYRFTVLCMCYCNFFILEPDVKKLIFMLSYMCNYL